MVVVVVVVATVAVVTVAIDDGVVMVVLVAMIVERVAGMLEEERGGIHPLVGSPSLVPPLDVPYKSFLINFARFKKKKKKEKKISMQ